MADRLVTDTTMVALERALDGTAAQQRAVANNLANLETPGYVARHVNFEGALRSALHAARQGEDEALDLLQPMLVSDSPSPDQSGAGGVDIEHEMTQMSEASVRYEALVRFARRKFEMIGTAIGDGRGG